MTGDKPATDEGLAAINEVLDSEPWTHTPGEWKPPTNAEWEKLANPYLMTLRLAWVTMYKTRAELLEIAATLDDEAGRELKDSFTSTIGFFKHCLAILENANFRTQCAEFVFKASVTGEADAG